MTVAPAPTATELRERLPELMLRDEHRLARRLEGVRHQRDPAKRQRLLTSLAAQMDAAERRIARRREHVPAVEYPPELPVSERRDDIAAAIRDHQVVILAGETGSGKTTQLPKICLELGRGVRGLIGHTQPRRIAARAVAERVAEELGTELGGAVGYTVRFHNQVGEDTLVKVMTDGILLAEIQNDRELRRYDTIILDEAHERSLTIDFLLGYLSQLLPRRPDLKVIVTSATIETGRFSRHFGDAPVIEVSGRTYPVEVRYRPVSEDDPDRDQTEAVCDAVDELSAEGLGDILVFLSGEREIRDTAEALTGRVRPGTEVLPLYGRLSAAEQHRVFAPHQGRRVVLATNVAETSLTVPGIAFVVDPGTARISRYSARTKVQRLPIEPISQASANQRAGRCGRVSNGVCIRLYAEDDLLARPAFTDPEILRTNLASVILSMTALGLGDVADFPFLDPPDRRAVKDGIDLLRELGALEPGALVLTPLGRQLAQLPLDPRLARMVLEADREGCLREVLVIAAALSIQDPRERPTEHRQAADAQHARFADPGSDFLTLLALWRYLREQQQALSSSQFRRMCRRDFLNYLRIREWQDLVTQLRQVCTGLGIRPAEGDADGARIHRALLAGLLSHVGLADRERGDFQGARGVRFSVFPGSVLARKPPRFVMAAELVETSRLFARTVARVEPEWAEQLGAHLVTRAYSEPRWERRRGAAVATEKVALYGVPLLSRTVGYHQVDPEGARELFIRHALVEGDWDTHHAFFRTNQELLEHASDLENRARRRDLVVDDEALFDFYDARLPAEAVSARHFDSWWKQVRRSRPDLLTFSLSMLVTGGVEAAGFPDTVRQGDLALELGYSFEPGSEDDGVAVEVPLVVLNRLDSAGFEWQVPGRRHELVTALLRSLPKPLRVRFVPAPDVAATVLARVGPADGPLLAVLERELHRLTGVSVPRTAWQLDRVPDHLRVSFRVVDEAGATVGQGKDLTALQRRLAPRVRAELSSAVDDVVRTGLRAWTIGTLPRTVERRHGAHLLRGFPALVDGGDSVAVRVLDTETQQRQAMARGTRRLLLLTVPSPVKAVSARLDNRAKLTLAGNPHGGVAALLADCAAAAVDALVDEQGGPAWDEEGFAKLVARVRAELPGRVLTILGVVTRILAVWQAVQPRTAAVTGPARADLTAQLGGLVPPGFVAAAGARRLPDLLRYLQAVERRLDRLTLDPARDLAWQRRVEDVTKAWRQALAAFPPGQPAGETLGEVRWMIEELRVSLFAQELRTRYPISEERIYRALDDAPAQSRSIRRGV